MDRSHLEELLAGLVRSGGTTLHLITDQPPSLRIKGALVAAADTPMSGQVIGDLARDLLFADHRARLEQGEVVDVLYSSHAGLRFRTTVIPQLSGLSMVFRRVPDTVPSLRELELPELLSSLVGFRSGLVLTTGFFGSGKSTTLAAMVGRLNQERPVHVVTIEDPIEYIHQPAMALVHQRELGTHVATIEEGVAEATRLGAEVIAIGELRDWPGLRAAIHAAERGSLVLATFTASCVVGAIAELLRLVPGDERLRVRYRFVQVLRAIVSQTLIRKRHSQGRIPLLEILVKNENVAKAIRRGRLQLLPELMARGRGLGMQTNDMALRALLNRHLITTEEAAYHAVDRDWVCSPRAPAVPS